MAAAGGLARGTATPRERGSPHPTSAKARRDELDQRCPAPPRRRPSAERPRPGEAQDAGRAPEGVLVYAERGGGRGIRSPRTRDSTVAGGAGAQDQGTNRTLGLAPRPSVNFSVGR